MAPPSDLPTDASSNNGAAGSDDRDTQQATRGNTGKNAAPAPRGAGNKPGGDDPYREAVDNSGDSSDRDEHPATTPPAPPQPDQQPTTSTTADESADKPQQQERTTKQKPTPSPNNEQSTSPTPPSSEQQPSPQPPPTPQQQPSSPEKSSQQQTSSATPGRREQLPPGRYEIRTMQDDLKRVKEEGSVRPKLGAGEIITVKADRAATEQAAPPSAQTKTPQTKTPTLEEAAEDLKKSMATQQKPQQPKQPPPTPTPQPQQTQQQKPLAPKPQQPPKPQKPQESQKSQEPQQQKPAPSPAPPAKKPPQQQPERPTPEPEPQQQSSSQRWLLIALLVGVLALAGAAGWWFVLRTPPPPTTPTPPEQPEEPEEPQPSTLPGALYPDTVPAIGIQTLFNATTTSPAQFRAVLTAIVEQQEIAPNTLFGIQLQGARTGADVLSRTGLAIPQRVLDALAGEAVSAPLLFGASDANGAVRFGVAIQIGDPSNITDVRAALRAWEPTMDADLDVLFNGFARENPASGTFLETTRNGVSVRYRNFSNPSIAMDYAILEQTTPALLIMTTSRESMFLTIDYLQQRTGIQETTSETP